MLSHTIELRARCHCSQVQLSTCRVKPYKPGVGVAHGIEHHKKGAKKLGAAQVMTLFPRPMTTTRAFMYKGSFACSLPVAAEVLPVLDMH